MIRSMGTSVPSSRTNAFLDAARTACSRVGAQGGQEVDGFGDVAVSGGRADAETGRELGVGVPVAG